MLRPTLVVLSLSLTITCAAMTPAHAQWSPSGVELKNAQHQNSRLTGFADPAGVTLTWLYVANTPAYFARRIGVDGVFPPGWESPAHMYDYAFPASTVSDGAGGLLSVYAANVGSVSKVYFVHTAGAGFLPEPLISDTTTYFGIAMDGAGGAFVTAVKRRTVSVYDVRLRRFNNDGTPATGWPTWATIATGSFIYALQMTSDGAGGSVVAWASISDAQTRVLRVTASGAVFPGWPSGGVVLPAESDKLSIFSSGSDGWIVMLQKSSGTTLFRVRADGVVDPAWPAAGLVVVPVDLGNTPLTVMPDGQGGLWLAWTEGGAPLMRRVTSSGTFAPGFVSGPQPLLPSSAQYAGTYAVTSTASGGLLYAWADSLPPTGLRVGWRLLSGASDPSEPDSGRLVIPGIVYSATILEPKVSVLGICTDGAEGGYLGWQSSNITDYAYVYVNRIAHTALLDVPTPLASRPATLALAPNPASHRLDVRFALPSSTPARLELLDVTGRRLRDRNVSGAGDHVERFDDLGALRPGIYLVRVTQGAQVRVARAALVH